MTGIKTMKVDDYFLIAENRFGRDPRKWKFVCPMCNKVQSVQDFLNLKERMDEDTIRGHIGFSCIGTFNGRGTEILFNDNNEKSKHGCNYTLGGLFQIHTIEIKDNDGKTHPRFELAEE